MTQWVKYLLRNIRTYGQIPWTCIKNLGTVVLVCNAVLWGEAERGRPLGLTVQPVWLRWRAPGSVRDFVPKIREWQWQIWLLHTHIHRWAHWYTHHTQTYTESTQNCRWYRISKCWLPVVVMHEAPASHLSHSTPDSSFRFAVPGNPGLCVSRVPQECCCAL